MPFVPDNSTPGLKKDELKAIRIKRSNEALNAANIEAARTKQESGFANTIVRLTGMGKTADTFARYGANKMSSPEARQFAPTPTRGEMAGAIGNTALLAYPGSTVAKAVKFVAGSLLGKIASKGAEKAVTGASSTLAKSNLKRGISNLVGNSAAFGGAGYGYEASQNLIEGKTGAEAYIPGLQTAVSAALPLTPIVFSGAKKALGRAAQETFGATTGAGMGVVRAAYEAAKEGGEKAAAFTKAMRGNTSPEEIVGAAKESLGEIIQKRSADYEQALSKVAGMTEQIDTTPVAKAIENGLAKFGVKVTADGLDFSRSTLRFNKKAQEEIKTIVDEMAQFGSKEGDNTALGVDRLKRAFSDLYSDSSEARAFVANVTGETRKLLSKVPGYDEMAKAYGDSTGLIKEIQKGLSLGNKASVDTAFRKLSTTLRTNNEFRQQLVEELDKISGGTLSAQIAGQQLSEVVPRGLAKVGIAGAGAIGLATGGLGVVALLKLAATSSPRLIGEFANALGIGAKAFNKFLQGIGVKAGVDAVQKTRLPGDVLLDSPFGKQLKKGIQEVQGKGGLSIQDVSKNDPLLQEAGKYKSAEEFVKAQQPQKVKVVSATQKADYMGGHEAPMGDSGAPIWDLNGKYTDHAIYPADFYTHGHYYAAGETYDSTATSIMQSLKDRPNASVKVYRAVSKDVKNPKLNAGDWISTTREYAKDHGESNLGGNYKIISANVKARDIFTDGNSIHEFGYDPQPAVLPKDMPYDILKRTMDKPNTTTGIHKSQLTDLYNKAQGTKRGFGTGAGRGGEDKTALLTDSKKKLSNFLKGLKTDKMNESDAAEFIKETEKMLKPTMSASRIKSYMEDVQFEIDKVLKERGKESLKGEWVKSLIQSAAKATDYTSWIKKEGLKASDTMKQLYLDAKRKLKK